MSAHRVLHDLLAAPYLQEDPGTDGGTLRVDRQLSVFPIVTTGAHGRTLAQPTKAGLICTVLLKTDGGNLTLTVTGGFDQGGSDTMVFGDAGDWATFVSVVVGTSYYWRVLNNEGTNYSQDVGTFGEVSATNVNSTNVTASSTVQAATTNATNTNATNVTASGTVQAATTNATNTNATNVTASSTVQAATVNATNVTAANIAQAATVNATEVTATNVNATNVTASNIAQAATVNATNVTAANVVQGATVNATEVTATNVNATNVTAALVGTIAVNGATVTANTVGFFGAGPAAQPTGIANSNNNVDNLSAQLNSVIAALETLGLLATV